MTALSTWVSLVRSLDGVRWELQDRNGRKVSQRLASSPLWFDSLDEGSIPEIGGQLPKTDFNFWLPMQRELVAEEAQENRMLSVRYGQVVGEHISSCW